MKRQGKRILSLLLAAVIILTDTAGSITDTAQTYAAESESSGDISGDAADPDTAAAEADPEDSDDDADDADNLSTDSNAAAADADSAGSSDLQPQTGTDSADSDDSTADSSSDTAQEASDLVGSDVTVSEEAAASVTAYTYSHTYTSLKSVTLSPSTETVSAVSTALITFLKSKEGNYSSVNKNDNGSLSLGILQWHGNNALKLMRLIVSADNTTAYNTLGSSLYNEIISSSTSWASRTLTSSEATLFAACMSTTTGISIQDQLAASYAATYINAATDLGIRNASALLIYGDVANQRGTSGALTTAAAAAQLAGSYSAVTANDMLIASIYCYPTSSSIYASFVRRRLSCYQYAVDLGWSYKLDADLLIPTSQTAAESTAVSWVQRTLNLVSGSSLTVNGTYDSATTAAVTAFQSAQGLTADGETGVYTIAALACALYTYQTGNSITTAVMCGSTASTGTTSTSSSSSSSSSSTSTAASSTLKISSYNYPTTIKKGNSYSIKGTIKSNYKITKVTVKILDSDGKTVLSASAAPNSKSYKLQTKLDAKIKFSKLSAGTYTYKVTATDTKKSKTLVSKTFKVRSLTISSTRYPTKISKGSSYTIKGTIKSSYKITKVTVQILDSDGNVVLSASAKPNKKSYKLQTKLDAKIKFSKLSKGTYTYKVIASDTKTSNVTLLKKTFKVK